MYSLREEIDRGKWVVQWRLDIPWTTHHCRWVQACLRPHVRTARGLRGFVTSGLVAHVTPPRRVVGRDRLHQF